MQTASFLLNKINPNRQDGAAPQIKKHTNSERKLNESIRKTLKIWLICYALENFGTFLYS
jgi:hypothetical protein